MRTSECWLVVMHIVCFRSQRRSLRNKTTVSNGTRIVPYVTGKFSLPSAHTTRQGREFGSIRHTFITRPIWKIRPCLRESNFQITCTRSTTTTATEVKLSPTSFNISGLWLGRVLWDSVGGMGTCWQWTTWPCNTEEFLSLAQGIFWLS